jgi:acyl-CoA thioester hydrolase
MTATVMTFRVRYAESDQMGFAHHAAYVVWLEAGRIEWLREHGFSYRQLETEGVLMPVTEVQVQYRRPLRFDDEVEATTDVVSMGRSRMEFRTEIRLRGDPELRSEGRVVIAAVGPDGRPRRLPENIVSALQSPEVGGQSPEVRKSGSPEVGGQSPEVRKSGSPEVV